MELLQMTVLNHNDISDFFYIFLYYFLSFQGKSALWSHLLAFQLECEELEEAVPTYSQDTNSLSPSAGTSVMLFIPVVCYCALQ